MNYLNAVQSYLDSLSTSSRTFPHSRVKLAELLVTAREHNWTLDEFIDAFIVDGIDKGRKATLEALTVHALKNGYEFNVTHRDFSITKDSIHTQKILSSWDELYQVVRDCKGFSAVAALLAIVGVNPGLMSSCTIHSDRVDVLGEVGRSHTKRVINFNEAELQLVTSLGITEEDVLLLDGAAVDGHNTSFSGVKIRNAYHLDAPEDAPSLMALRKASLQLRYKEGVLIEALAEQYGISPSAIERNL